MGMGVGLFWIAFVSLFTVAWVATTWIRARHGYPLEGSDGGTVRQDGGGETIRELREKLAAQEAALGKLEERVQVLERIVTDESGRLAEEIERLRA